MDLLLQLWFYTSLANSSPSDFAYSFSYERKEEWNPSSSSSNFQEVCTTKTMSHKTFCPPY